MKLLVLLALVPGVVFSDYSFYKFSPASQVINGTAYPRNNLLTYRGTGDGQMDVTKAIRAMMGDETAVVETYLYSGIKATLLGRTPPKPISLSSKVQSKLTALLNSKSITTDNVDAHTKDLVDMYFNEIEANNQVISRYINYRGNYVDWPDDVVFTTVVSPPAASYGPNMLVFKESTPRSIDLNYWNKVNNGIWFDHTRDAGEFVAPGFIPNGDIIGFQFRNSSGGRSYHSIEYAFYKASINGKPLLIVIDGEGQSCINRVSDFDFRLCSYTVPNIVTEIPPDTTQKPKYFGIVTFDGDESLSKDAFRLLKNYQGSSSNSKIKSLISNLTVNKRNLKWIDAQ